MRVAVRDRSPAVALQGNYSGKQESEFRRQNKGTIDEYGEVAEPIARSKRSVS